MPRGVARIPGPGALPAAPHWLYRLWELGQAHARLWGAHALACAADMAGLRVTDRRAVTGAPFRWVEMAEDSPPLP
ncbi:hypothetical protein ACWDZ6_19475 [Streptomyces sp. NPDC002926]